MLFSSNSCMRKFITFSENVSKKATSLSILIHMSAIHRNWSRIQEIIIGDPEKRDLKFEKTMW